MNSSKTGVHFLDSALRSEIASFKRSMERGSSRLKAWILRSSSSNRARKSWRVASLSEAEESWERKSVMVLGTKEGLKSKLSSEGTEPIGNWNWIADSDFAEEEQEQLREGGAQ